MAPDQSFIMRDILAEATDVITHDVKSYVEKYHDIKSRLMKADPMGSEENPTHPAHMHRPWDGLSV